MAGNVSNQPSDMGREPVPNTREEQVTDEVTSTGTGEQRGSYDLGTAEILVVDFFRFVWPDYQEALPQGRRVLMVPDTKTAKLALEQNPHIKVVVIQGWSRTTENDILSEGVGTTVAFVDDLLETGWPWRVYVVSTVLKTEEFKGFERLAPAQVRVMHKKQFFKVAPELLDHRIDEPLIVQTARRSIRRQMQEAVQQYSLDSIPFSEWELWKSLGRARRTCMRLDDVIAGGDPEAILQFIVSELAFYPKQDGSCVCRARRREVTGWWNWLHANHHQMNQALWQALAADPDVLELVALELEADLLSMGALPGYGRIAPKLYGRRLLTFLRSGGSDPTWV